MHLPIWEEHIIIHMIGVKFAPVKMVMQVPGSQLCWELNLVVRSTQLCVKNFERTDVFQ
jgi:hypothetical protein